jgi:hypothetical protein
VPLAKEPAMEMVLSASPNPRFRVARTVLPAFFHIVEFIPLNITGLFVENLPKMFRWIHS